MAFGTFDMVHEGHKHFFQQARDLAKTVHAQAQAHLIVSLARDVNVKRIKGKPPRNSERKRLLEVKKQAGVDRVVLGSIDDYIAHIVQKQPDIIALGYDQKAYTQGLRPALRKAGWDCQVVRLKAYKPRTFKTSRLLK